MIEVVISRLGMDPSTQSYVVVLQEKGGTRLLPIWIGQAEADAIVVHIQGIKHPRPMTHDLCSNIIIAAGSTLRRAQITRVEDNTYFGELHLDRGGVPVIVDSRPSDAIAVAIRLNAPIFAAERLLVDPAEDADEESADSVVPSEPPPRDGSADRLKEYLEHLPPEDFGKFKL
ncbi:MAG: bifunctional nuclease family protein [Gemmatimonadaceae bacterium]